MQCRLTRATYVCVCVCVCVCLYVYVCVYVCVESSESHARGLQPFRKITCTLSPNLVSLKTGLMRCERL